MYKTTLLLSTALIFTIGCGRDNIKNASGSNQTSSNNYKNTFVYDKNSPYKDALKKCVLIEDEKQSCSLSTLPLIAQDGAVTKERIMQRLLVSHTWMAERFSQMLDVYSDKKIQELFGSTTAIVIDDDIIPAYYWAVTGAIYLDPRYFWMTPSEKKDITQKEDYRSGYGTTMQFLEATLYRQNGQSLYNQNKESRTLSDIELPLAGLLYHELTHANDFIPQSVLGSLDNSLSVLDNVVNIGTSRTSDSLYGHSPLQSERLKELGKVFYKGQTPTPEQEQLTGLEVGHMFDADVADAMYAYATPFEDTAMLFQSAMMKYFYNVDSYQIFINAEAYEKSSTIDIEWGIKNPVLKTLVLDRAVFVANRILPSGADWSGKLHGIHDNPVEIKNFYMGKSNPLDTLHDIQAEELQVSRHIQSIKGFK